MPTDKPKLKANIGIVYGMGKTNAGRKRRELRTSEGRSKNGQDRDARVNHLIPTKSSKCDKNILKISVAIVVRVGVRGGGSVLPRCRYGHDPCVCLPTPSPERTSAIYSTTGSPQVHDFLVLDLVGLLQCHQPWFDSRETGDHIPNHPMVVWVQMRTTKRVCRDSHGVGAIDSNLELRDDQGTDIAGLRG